MLTNKLSRRIEEYAKKHRISFCEAAAVFSRRRKRKPRAVAVPKKQTEEPKYWWKD